MSYNKITIDLKKAAVRFASNRSLNININDFNVIPVPVVFQSAQSEHSFLSVNIDPLNAAVMNVKLNGNIPALYQDQIEVNYTVADAEDGSTLGDGIIVLANLGGRLILPDIYIEVNEQAEINLADYLPKDGSLYQIIPNSFDSGKGEFVSFNCKNSVDSVLNQSRYNSNGKLAFHVSGENDTYGEFNGVLASESLNNQLKKLSITSVLDTKNQFGYTLNTFFSFENKSNWSRGDYMRGSELGLSFGYRIGNEQKMVSKFLLIADSFSYKSYTENTIDYVELEVMFSYSDSMSSRKMYFNLVLQNSAGIYVLDYSKSSAKTYPLFPFSQEPKLMGFFAGTTPFHYSNIVDVSGKRTITFDGDFRLDLFMNPQDPKIAELLIKSIGEIVIDTNGTVVGNLDFLIGTDVQTAPIIICEFTGTHSLNEDFSGNVNVEVDSTIKFGGAPQESHNFTLSLSNSLNEATEKCCSCDVGITYLYRPNFQSDYWKTDRAMDVLHYVAANDIVQQFGRIILRGKKPFLKTSFSFSGDNR